MTDHSNTVALAHGLTLAWLSNPGTHGSAGDVAAFLVTMRDAVAGLSRAVEAEQAAPDTIDYPAAVTVRTSLASPDVIISMIDGKPYRTLKRHLSSRGLTPDDYRARYRLGLDYPMVAASYSEERSALARKLGLGRKRGEKAETAGDVTPARKRRLSIFEAKQAAKAHLEG
jgi:predicted transcriptional regulator